MVLLRGFAASVLSAISLVLPVQAYDLHYRLNGANLSAEQLRQALNRGLPRSYDQLFPDQQWSTYLLLDGHPGKGLVAITMGLSPRIGRSQALLPIATYSVIEPIPATAQQWQQLLSAMAGDYGNQVITNRARILTPR
jgi:hypothetical protein